MELLELIKQRYSVRDFSSRVVEQEVLDKILEAGRLAPTAKNNQPQQIYVLRSNEALDKIRQVTPCHFGSNTILMLCADTSVCWSTPDGKYSSAVMDISIVGTHMMLEATDLGIGSCWVLRFDREKTKELFNLPQNIEPFCLLVLGYPTENGLPSDRHFSRKEKSLTVTEL